MNDKFNEMMDKISSSSAEDNKRLAENMKNNLSDSQKKAVERLLSDAGLMNKLLENEKVTFHDVPERAGQLTGEAQKGLPSSTGKLVIGPAGENKVLYSGVFSGERTAGRGGVGAVFGDKNLKAVIQTTSGLGTPATRADIIEKNGMEYVQTTDLESALPELDILYMTRIQGERFADKAEYERLKDIYILSKAKLKGAKPTLSILHPLPRVNEISVDVDDDPRACYFKQVLNGVIKVLIPIATVLLIANSFKVLIANISVFLSLPLSL